MEPDKGTIEDLDVLMDYAVVVEQVTEKKNPLVYGASVNVPAGVELEGMVYVGKNRDETTEKVDLFTGKDSVEVTTVEDAIKRLTSHEGVVNVRERKTNTGSNELRVIFEGPTVLKFSRISRPMPGKLGAKNDRHSDPYVALSVMVNMIMVHLDRESSKKLYALARQGKLSAT